MDNQNLESLSDNPMSTLDYPVSNKKRTGGDLKGVIAVAFLLLLVGGMVLATKAWDPLWNPFRMKSDQVMSAMTDKMKTVKTISSDMAVSLQNQKQDSLDVKISAKNDSNNKKTTLSFALAVNQSGMSASVSGDSIVIGRDGYVKLNNIPPIFSSLIGQVQGQWFKYGQESDVNEMNDGNIERLQELFMDSKWYIVEKELSDERIDKVKTYHYIVALNQIELKKTFAEFIKQSQGAPVQPGAFGKVDYEKIASSILDEFFEKAEDIKAEIWIGKKDYYLYKIKAEKEIDLKSLTKKSSDAFDFSVDIEFSGFNREINIEAPKNFKDFKELQKGNPALLPML